MVSFLTFGGTALSIIGPILVGVLVWRRLGDRSWFLRIIAPLGAIAVTFAAAVLSVAFSLSAAEKYEANKAAFLAISHSAELNKVSLENPDLRQKMVGALIKNIDEKNLNPRSIHRVYIDLVAPVAVRAPREDIIRHGIAIRNLLSALAERAPEACSQVLGEAYWEHPPKAAITEIDDFSRSIAAAYKGGMDHPSATIIKPYDVISAEDAADIAERVYALPSNPFTEDEINRDKSPSGDAKARCLLSLKFYTNLLNGSVDDQENILRAFLVQ